MRILILLLIVFILSCKSKTDNPLVGKWQVKVEEESHNAVYPQKAFYRFTENECYLIDTPHSRVDTIQYQLKNDTIITVNRQYEVDTAKLSKVTNDFFTMTSKDVKVSITRVK